MNFLILAITALAIFAVLLALKCYKKLVASGMFLSHRRGGQPVFRRCGECEGCGVTMLDGSPIPKSVRSVQQTSKGMIWPGSIANTKTCSGCQGLGSHWVEPTTNQPRPNSVDRRWL